MSEFITVPIETDPEVLAQEALEYLASVIPGFEANAGNLETWLMEAMARIAAEVRDTASDVPLAIFRWYGATVVNLPPIDALAASGTSTWTAIDTQGYTIAQGTRIALPSSGDQLVAFEVVADVVIPPGNTVTGTGEVILVAIEAGAAGNDLAGPGELIDPLGWVDAITLPAPTSGGQDAEDDETYINRLRSELQLLTPRPILPNDFAVLARTIVGVERATAIDGLIPPSSFGNERAIAVAVIDEDGLPVSAPIQTQVDDLLQSLREVTFIVNVIDPDYTSIDVTFAATLVPGDEFVAADVQAAAELAVSEYLSPANWGLPFRGDVREWINDDTVRYFEIVSVLDRVEGLDYITSLTVDGGTSDVVMTGNAPLPTPGTISGTVT